MNFNVENVMQPPAGLVLPKWEPGDGPAPYVWKSLPRGHRCAWTCHWVVRGLDREFATPNGPQVLKTTALITPLQWAGCSPEDMTAEQIIAELQDHLDQGGFHAQEAYRTICAFADNDMAVLYEVEKLIRRVRETYQEFEAGLNVPDPQVYRQSGLRAQHRPGWAELWRVKE